MYSIEYLPFALYDLQDITRYIAQELGSPSAAQRIAEGIVAAVDSLADMPYRRAVYVPIKSLDREYRTIRHGNYVAFYWIEEQRKVVTVARILYGKTDFSTRLAAAERKL